MALSIKQKIPELIIPGFVFKSRYLIKNIAQSKA